MPDYQKLLMTKAKGKVSPKNLKEDDQDSVKKKRSPVERP